MKTIRISLVTALLCAFVLSPAKAEDVRILLLPISFSDCPFTYSKEGIQEKATEAAAYFKRQTGDSYHINVGMETKLENTLSYYGANSISVKDALLPEAIVEACNKVNPYVDFSKYEHLIIYAAGPSEADGAGEDYIWPKASSLGPLSLLLDWKKIDAYGVCCELGPDGSSLAGIGDLCHEIGHLIGLKDLYDISLSTQPEETSNGLGGTLSLMDCGNRLDEGRTPSLLSAVDLELLGKGRAEELSSGHHTLPARGDASVYLKLKKPDNGNEFFLFECRRREGQDAFIDREGLISYHVDRSTNNAGWSMSQKKALTAEERWKYNEVNANPDHECATVCKKLVFWDGSGSTLAIRNVHDTENGAVEFDVLETISIEELSVFQDAAILRWDSDFQGQEIIKSSVSLKKEGGEWQKLEDGKRCLLIDNLADGVTYFLKIELTDSTEEEFSYTTKFSTPKIRKGTWPFIYLYGAERNTDGTFKPGSKLALRLYNPNGVSSVVWYFDGKEIAVGEDCYWHIPGSGTLKAVAIVNGGIETLEKKINVK